MLSFTVLVISIVHVWLAKTNDVLTFSAIAADLIESPWDSSIVGSQWLAIQEINDNPNLLPYFTLELDVYDSNGDYSTAINHAIDIVNNPQKQNHTHFPIVLGCSFSTFSTRTSPILAAYNYGQISSSSTSIALSDPEKYPNFYRTVPSNKLSAEGIILLCQAFNWSNIAIVYVNYGYGQSLSATLVELAWEHGIETKTVSFLRRNEISINKAAQQVKEMGTFIIVLIDNEYETLVFDVFQQQGLTEYPYYYIGVGDGWFSEESIEYDISKYVMGAIGTVSWNPNVMALESYDAEIQPIINDSIKTVEDLLSSWTQHWENGYSSDLYLELPLLDAVIYGYDAMYVLAYALEIYLEKGYDILDSINMTKLNEIIINEIGFRGASGWVELDENGDRMHGLYAFGNILEDGTISYIGYFYKENDELKSFIDYTKIIWPSDFVERGILPRSSILIMEEILIISQSVRISMFSLFILSVIIVIACIALTLVYRNNPILKAASWRLNLIMSGGALFGYMSVIAYGIDENWMDAGILFTAVCNFRLSLLVLSYTLLFIPLFAKTYRLTKISTAATQQKVMRLSDKMLLYRILICLIIDLLLLAVYVAIEPLQRIYIVGKTEQIDELQNLQYLYGACDAKNIYSSYIFYGAIVLWKFIESLFGIYYGLRVFCMHHPHRRYIMKFDESAQQLWSMLILFVAFCIAIPLGILHRDNPDPSAIYCLVGILIIFVGNATITINMLPPLCKLVKVNTNQKYSHSPKYKLELAVVNRLETAAIDSSQTEKTEIYQYEHTDSDDQDVEFEHADTKDLNQLQIIPIIPYQAALSENPASAKQYDESEKPTVNRTIQQFEICHNNIPFNECQSHNIEISEMEDYSDNESKQDIKIIKTKRTSPLNAIIVKEMEQITNSIFEHPPNQQQNPSNIMFNYPSNSKTNGKTTSNSNNDKEKQQDSGNNGCNKNNGNHNNNTNGISGNGKDDSDDEKKNNNDKNISDSIQDTEEENDDDEDEEDEDEEESISISISNSTLNREAPEFIPAYSPSKSSSKTLSTIAENETSPNPVNKKRHKKKADKTRKCHLPFDPITCCRAKGNIQISRELTTKIIPDRILEGLHAGNDAVYKYLDISTALQLDIDDIKRYSNGDIKILNYDFHDKNTNESLYCVIQKQDGKKNRNFYWKMVDKLFTANDIDNIYDIPTNKLPKSSRTNCNFLKGLDDIHKINDILKSEAIQSIIYQTKWHKVSIFSNENNNNREKITLSMTKQQFQQKMDYFMRQNPNPHLIPIILFNNNNNNEYWTEFIQIIRITDNIDIGISYKYISKSNRFELTAIYLNKQQILNQHQIISPQHECHCLDNFVSCITSLKIGNLKELDNKLKDLQKRNAILLQENKKLRNEKKLKQQNDELLRENKNMRKEKRNIETENEFLKKEIDKLQDMYSYNNNTRNIVSPSISNSTPIYHSYPRLPSLNNNNNNNNNNTVSTPLYLNTIQLIQRDMIPIQNMNSSSISIQVNMSEMPVNMNVNQRYNI